MFETYYDAKTGLRKAYINTMPRFWTDMSEMLGIKEKKIMTKIATLHTEYGDWECTPISKSIEVSITNKHPIVIEGKDVMFTYTTGTGQLTSYVVGEYWSRKGSYITVLFATNPHLPELIIDKLMELYTTPKETTPTRDPDFLYFDNLIVAKDAVKRIEKVVNPYDKHNPPKHGKLVMKDGVEWRVDSYADAKKQFDMPPTSKGD
jgi:hypothetical protein